jgi:hypothetical protein
MTPKEFIDYVAGFSTFKECMDSNLQSGAISQEEYTQQLDDGPDYEWIQNDAEDLAELVMKAREIRDVS